MDDKCARAILLLYSKMKTSYTDPPAKQESMQLIYKGSPPPEKAKTQFSAGKVMDKVFWNMEGILLIECIPKGTSITGIV